MKTPFSIKLIYWIVNSLFWIFILGLVAIGVENILMYVSPDAYSFSRLGITLPLDLLAQTTIELNGTNTPVKIYGITGTVNVWELGLITKIIYYGSVFIVGSILIYALAMIKKIIANVMLDNVFTLANVIYLKRASYMFFLSWFLIDVVLRLSKQLLYSPAQSSMRLSTDYMYSNYLIIASIILGIAYIFERGVKLQNYKDLTI